MNITHNSRNVLTIEMDDVKSGWEKWFLLSSDRHWDAVNCDRKLMLQHLGQAKERDAHILDTGDFFSMMEGRYDPRRNFDNMRPEYVMQNYLDAISDDAIKQLKPYADRFLLLGRGNHDQAVKKHNGTDVMSTLAKGLRGAGANVQLGGYSGWVRFQFIISGTQKVRKQLYYFHGSGGGGEVTRGVIRSNRMSVYIDNADFIITGHTHDMWDVPIAHRTLNNKGNIVQYNCRCINLGTYADDYGDGYDGYFVESGKSPRPRGAAWLRFYLLNNEIKSDITFAID